MVGSFRGEVGRLKGNVGPLGVAEVAAVNELPELGQGAAFTATAAARPSGASHTAVVRGGLCNLH